ncbi:aminoacyl-tRNA hydrolase [Patescibacteria group bacterium]|nr:aminoacyl-tRNA hydrolase [Patescibacteria group bacterium]MBU1758206.1 aminoacyl-tRNA hydrolase [Patescibacteria group bacterium]
MSQIVNFYKIPLEDMLIIHDDIDLPTAKIQSKL